MYNGKFRRFRKGELLNVNDGIVLEIDKYKIKICQNVLNIMKKYIQKGFFSVESGGILIGKENMSNNNLIITHLTIPMSKDKQKHNRFFRRDKGHIEIFNNLYNESSEILRYIGEWHTHPEAIPNYSHIDSNNWKKINDESPFLINHYHFIIGYEAMRIWLFYKESKNTELIATIFWKDVNNN